MTRAGESVADIFLTGGVTWKNAGSTDGFITFTNTFMIDRPDGKSFQMTRLRYGIYDADATNEVVGTHCYFATAHNTYDTIYTDATVRDSSQEVDINVTDKDCSGGHNIWVVIDAEFDTAGNFDIIYVEVEGYYA